MCCMMWDIPSAIFRGRQFLDSGYLLSRLIQLPFVPLLWTLTVCPILQVCFLDSARFLIIMLNVAASSPISSRAQYRHSMAQVAFRRPSGRIEHLFQRSIYPLDQKIRDRSHKQHPEKPTTRNVATNRSMTVVMGASRVATSIAPTIFPSLSRIA